MNLAELKDRVFRMTGNTYNDTFHMRDLINSALTTLSEDARLEGVQSIQVVAGTSGYPLPVGYKSPRALVDGKIDNPSRIYDLIPIDETRHGYAIWNGQIILKPTPGETLTMNFYYYKYATQLVTDLDNPDSAFNDYADVVASYAAAMILSLPTMTDTNKYLIDRYFNVWETGKARFKADRAKLNKQSRVRTVSQW